MSFLYLVLVVYLSASLSNAITVNSNYRSFTNAIKDGHITANTETLLFETYGKSGVITEQWSGGGPIYNSSTIISIYIDNEAIPSIQYNILLAHGMGFSIAEEEEVVKANGPWGTQYISHEASKGGLSHRFLIPFSSSIRITVQCTTSGTFWYWVHGIYNFPIVYSARFGIQLPSNTRLKLYKNVDVLLAPLEFIVMANVTNTAGALFMFLIVGNSSTMSYMEGCLRLKMDDDEEYQFLSSGFEDIFISSYYFDSGVFHSSEAALTYKSDPGLISAFRFFDSDPMLFSKSLEVVWRCGETHGVNNNNGCPNTFFNGTRSESEDRNYTRDGFMNLKASETYVTTYTWVYEYTFE